MKAEFTAIIEAAWINPKNGAMETVPRHAEIKENFEEFKSWISLFDFKIFFFQTP